MSNYVMVVIDDLRSCKNEEMLLEAGTDLRYARTSAEGIQLLRELIEAGTVVDEIWLDHDLGPDDESKYGYDTIMPVVAYLEELGSMGQTEQVGSVMIHTANIAMVPTMNAALSPYFRTIRVNASDFFVSASEW